jgi:hypothetical protein
VREFVGLISKALVLFYQLDSKYGETSEICLQNMLTSMILKNPIYTLLINLLKQVFKDDIDTIDANIQEIKDKYDIQ